LLNQPLQKLETLSLGKTKKPMLVKKRRLL